MIKVKEFVMAVRNNEFIDALFQVEISEAEKKYLGIETQPLLCITYDKGGECIIIGLLDGPDIIEFELHQEEINEINIAIEKYGVYNEVIELACEINQVS